MGEWNRPPDAINLGDSEANRNVLLIAPYNAIPRPWYGVAWEFLEVISRVETATIVAPGGKRPFKGLPDSIGPHLMRVFNKGLSPVLRAMNRPSLANMARASLDADYDLCFYMCQFPCELADVERVTDWRRRSRIACAFVLETWTSTLGKYRSDLRILDKFDHVFVLNAESIPVLEKYTSTPISFLATGADCLLVPDCRPPRERSIDFLSIGRRNGLAHADLTVFARERNLFYVYDIWSGMTVPNWAEARQMNAELVRRAKYFLVWDPVNLLSVKDKTLTGQNAISTRYFEGAAGGAILIGSRPDVPEFDRLFDWPDSVIELPEDREGRWSAIAALYDDPDRRARIGVTNRAQSLRRHDWAYRWADVLRTLGLPRTRLLDTRVAHMREAADQEEAACAAASRVSLRPAGGMRG